MGDLRDTICALSSARGRAGIAVVRMSGAGSFALLDKIFLPSVTPSGWPDPRPILGVVRDPHEGSELDQVLVTRFPSPHSYTGEDVVEISLHGSPVLVEALLDCLCEGGARLAEPGEFTMRAFLNGRMDLTQAEAVRDLVEATTRYQAVVANRQRAGEVSRRLQPLKKSLINMIVNLESAVEFVEDDLDLESRDLLGSRIESLLEEVETWVASFRRGRIIRDGFSMAIIGRPNVGKSSLFNALLSQDRSIVTEIPGTTRDLVSEYTSLEGIPVRLVDTAGVRVSEDIIEQIGVDRSMRAMADADAILLVVDRSVPAAHEDELLRERLGDLSCIVVMNKSDLPDAWTTSEKAAYGGGWPLLEVSARTGERIDVMRRAILAHLFGDSGEGRDGILITNLRQCRCLEATRQCAARAAGALRAGLSEEFVLVDLHGALRHLGAMTGETGVEELLSEVFSRFCVGK
jgi:tRNA modification GTPase